MEDSIIGRKQNAGAFCPSCERFIGPVDVCPYCDADSARSPIFRFIRYGSVFLAFAGLAFLYLMASWTDIPAVRISEITPMMNFAVVRISGRVEREARVSKTKSGTEYVSFSVNDGTGRIRVVAYDDMARNLQERNLVPSCGTHVDVTGNLGVSADGSGTKLTLRRAEELHCLKE